MKRIAIVLLLMLTIMFSGCTVLKVGNQNSEVKTLQELGLAYIEGDYSTKGAYTSGFITTNSSIIRLAIPVSKRMIEGTEIAVTSISGAYLRTADGKYVLEEKADLTPYIEDASIRNDGAVLLVRLKNAEKWSGSDGKRITNNTPIAGTIDIEFTIKDALIQEAEASE